MIEWLRRRVWWQWVIAVVIVAAALDAFLMVTHSGSIDPTDPANFPTRSHHAP